jgi:rod shape-determining protein MreC
MSSAANEQAAKSFNLWFGHLNPWVQSYGRQTTTFIQWRAFPAASWRRFCVLLLPRSMTRKINSLFDETFQRLIRIGRHFPLENAAMPGPDEAFVSREEHNKLWKNYKNLHAQLMKLQEQTEAMARIRSGLPRFYSGLAIAEVTRTGAGLNHVLVINKGAADGIRAGQYVMSPGQNSIIGVVQETSEQIGRVRLLTDVNQSIEIRIRRDGTDHDVGALMIGNGKRGCTVSLVEREKDIRVGDAVYAAARPGILDIAMIIGEVSEVQADEESPLLWKIGVQPAENAFSLTTVAVIVSDTAAGGGR